MKPDSIKKGLMLTKYCQHRTLPHKFEKGKERRTGLGID